MVMQSQALHCIISHYTYAVLYTHFHDAFNIRYETLMLMFTRVVVDIMHRTVFCNFCIVFVLCIYVMAGADGEVSLCTGCTFWRARS